MTKHIRLVLPDADVSAAAALQESAAPRTCDTIWNALPFEDTLYHGIWSGPETYLSIDPSIRVAPENQTNQTQAGEIGYFTMEGGAIAGWPDDWSELAFFYDRGARPSMPTGPVAVNLFAHIIENLDGFARACDEIRRSGVTPLRVERVS